MNGLPIIALVSLLAVAPPDNEPARPRVLVFTRTAGFRHDAIPAGLAAVRELGTEGGFVVDATEDAAAFTPENLARYRAVVFLNTSGEVFDERQKGAFQGFIRGGGGLAAVHQGITTLEKWPWYVALVGGVKFAGHPAVQEATCRREVRDHPATRSLPDSWKWADEWYNFNPSPRPRTHVLLTVDESSYQGGTMGKDHPICWYHESQGGTRLVYSPGTHERGLRPGSALRQHLLGGIRYAAGLAPAGEGWQGTGGSRGRVDDRLRSRGIRPVRTGTPRRPGPRSRPVLRGQGRRLRRCHRRAAWAATSARTFPRLAASTSAPCWSSRCSNPRVISSKGTARRSSPSRTGGSSRGWSAPSRTVS